MRSALRVIAVAVAAFVLGSGMALLPALEASTCNYKPVGVPEGASWSGASLEGWPPSVACEYRISEARALTTNDGPGLATTLAWIAVVAALLALSVWRGSTAARGGIIPAAVLAIGALLTVDLQLLALFAVILGVPVGAAAHRLAGGTYSIVTALFVVPITFFLWIMAAFGEQATYGSALAIMGGAVIATALHHPTWLPQRLGLASRP